MERYAISVEAERPGMAQHVDRHRRHAAELARQRPFGALAVSQHAAEHTGLWRDTSDLLHFLDAIHSEQPDAQLISAKNVALLLDGVAEGDALRRRTGIHRHLDLGNRRGVEGRTHRSEQAQNFRRRVRFHCVIDFGFRQRLLEGAEIVAHDVKVEDHARAFRATGREEIEDALGGGHLVSPVHGGKSVAVRLRIALFERSSACGQRRDGFPWRQPVETPEP
jgi:hypothetical protein